MLFIYNFHFVGFQGHFEGLLYEHQNQTVPQCSLKFTLLAYKWKNGIEMLPHENSHVGHQKQAFKAGLYRQAKHLESSISFRRVQFIISICLRQQKLLKSGSKLRNFLRQFRNQCLAKLPIVDVLLDDISNDDIAQVAEPLQMRISLQGYTADQSLLFKSKIFIFVIITDQGQQIEGIQNQPRTSRGVCWCWRTLLFQRQKIRKMTMPMTQRAATTQRKKGRSISLSVVIIARKKIIEVIAWIWRTIEKDSRQPLFILAQLTLSQLVIQFITNPQEIPTSRGKPMVVGQIIQFAKVNPHVTSTANIPALPTLMTEYLSLIKALSIAPKMQPTPSDMSRQPTLSRSRMPSYISLLKQMLMKLLMIPSKMMGMYMQYMLGQYFIVLMKIDFICYQRVPWGGTAGFTIVLGYLTSIEELDSVRREVSSFLSSRSSKKRKQTSHEMNPRMVRRVKQIVLPKYPNPKVVTNDPRRLLPYTIPLVIPKYLPYSFLGMPQIRKSFIRQPP